MAVLQFQKFLHENFASPEQVQRAFSVAELRTVENWWAGRNRASAEIIMMAFGMFPDGAAQHLRLVAEKPEPINRPPFKVRVVA